MDLPESGIYRVQPNGMRLINTETLELQKFPEGSIPPYAILSHVWGNEDDECCFQDFKDTKAHSDKFKSKKGYAKIVNFCRKAQEYGHAWAWADTVCIDKTNYEELNTAINCMFTWYEQSEVCFAYLEDVEYRGPRVNISHLMRLHLEDVNSRPPSPLFEAFTQASWFTRGWTLQEFIAPSRLALFEKEWTFLFFRDDAGSDLWDLGNIPELVGFQRESIIVKKRRASLSGHTAETKMKWASRRKTRHSEDMAYCLLGLFDVQMPIRYGEGVQAFKRLQNVIINLTGDPTLLIWSQASSWSTPHGIMPHPYLASSPSNFRRFPGYYLYGQTLRLHNMSLTRDMIQQTASTRRKNDLIIHRPLIRTLDDRLALLVLGGYETVSYGMRDSKPNKLMFIPVLSAGPSKWWRANLPLMAGHDTGIMHCLSPTEVYLEDISDLPNNSTSCSSKTNIDACDTKPTVDRWVLVTFPLGMGGFGVVAAFPGMERASPPGSIPMAKLKSLYGATLVLENTLFKPPKRIGFLFVLDEYPNQPNDRLPAIRKTTCRVLSETDVEDVSQSGLQRVLEHHINFISLAAEDHFDPPRAHWRKNDQLDSCYAGIRSLWFPCSGDSDDFQNNSKGEEDWCLNSSRATPRDVAVAQLVLDCPKPSTPQLILGICESML